jgi:hypothetical protein
MTETLVGCIVGGAAIVIAVPLMFGHYLRERRRGYIVRHLRNRDLSFPPRERR